MLSTSVDPVSVQGYCQVVDGEDGLVVISNCEKKTIVAEAGSVRVIYVADSDSWRNFSRTKIEGDHQLGPNSQFYVPSYHDLNDVWPDDAQATAHSEEPPVTNISGHSRFFKANISQRLRGELSASGGPYIDGMVITSVEIEDVIATEAKTTRQDGTISQQAFDVHSVRWPISKTGNFHACRPMGFVKGGIEGTRRGLEGLTEYM